MTCVLDSTRLFVIEEDGRHIECEPLGPNLPKNKVSIRLDRLIFVDDHLEMWATRSARELRSLLAPLVPTQKKYNLTNNFSKTQICIQPRGKGSKKRIKSFGGQLKINQGGTVQLTDKLTYLGTIIAMNGSNRPAVTHRIRLAQQAHGRLTQNIYRSTSYRIQHKIKLFKTHELTVLLHGLDTKVLSKGDLDMLERWQMSKLRHISKSPAHITHETNCKLRKRLQVHTITSRLRHARLVFMRDIFKHPVTNAQLLAALYGTMTWDSHAPTTSTNRHVAQMHEDIVELWNALQEGPDPQSVPTSWEKNYVGPIMQQWLLAQTTTMLTAVLRYDNPRDARTHRQTAQTTEMDPTSMHMCDQCQRVFANQRAVSVHQYKVHGIRNKYRVQVENKECPGCMKTFTTQQNAQTHWAKQVCINNNTAIRTFADVEQFIANRQSTTDSTSNSMQSSQPLILQQLGAM